jgi:type IV pilus assembly protein PilB
MAQRLIRIICEECKTEDPQPDPHVLKVLGFQAGDLAGRTIMKGAGCSRCGGSGYRGRKGIFEMLIMNNELRELAFNRGTTTQVRKAARASGMKSLLEDGKLKILRGLTTPEEIARVAQAEGIGSAEEEEEE